MKRRRWRWGFVVLAVWGVQSAFGAEVHARAGTRAFTSLKIGVGAAAAAMGESGSALADDAYATYWNVAGLTRVRRSQVAFMNNAWVLDIRQNALAYAQPAGETASFSAFLTFLDYGELIGRDDTGAETHRFRPYDLTAGIGIAYRLGEGVSVGIVAKYLRQQIDEANAEGFAADFGIAYDVPETNLVLGAALQHLGTPMKLDKEGYALPTTFRFGVGYRLLNDNALVAVDGVFPADNDPRFSVGLSFQPFGGLTLRGGYRAELGGNELGATSGLAGGFGIRFSGLTLDYAFMPYGDLGPTNRLSLLVEF